MISCMDYLYERFGFPLFMGLYSVGSSYCQYYPYVISMNHQNVFLKSKVEVDSGVKIYGTVILCDRCLMLGYRIFLPMKRQGNLQ